MALREFLILRKLRSSCLEGCTAMIPANRQFPDSLESGAPGLPWQGTGGKRLKSLDTRLRGNDEMSDVAFLHRL